MTRRIVHIIPTLDRGGAEKQLALLVTRLPRDAYDAHVCVLTRTGPLQAALDAAGIPVHEIHKTRKVDPTAYWRLRRLLRHLRPDLAHTWLFAANSYGRYAASSAGVPHLVAGERCVDRWKVWHELAIDRYLARRTDRIVTNSSGVVEFYVQHGLPKHKFEVIANGVEVRESTTPTSRGQFIQSLGLAGDVRLIGAVGRLWPQKRHKDLIWAAELLRVIRDDTHLLIVGDGPRRARLERSRAQLGIGGRVHFLGQRDDVPDLLRHLDCFWLASAYEGQSNAVMEAMCAGVPVVVTDIPGNRDLVRHNQTGFLVPVGDRAAFARITNQLLDEPGLADRIGQAAREHMRTEFSVEKMVRRHVELYDQLIQK